MPHLAAEQFCLFIGICLFPCLCQLFQLIFCHMNCHILCLFQNPLQIQPHLLRRCITVFRRIGTGFQNDLPQSIPGITGHGNVLPADSSGNGILPVAVGNGFGIIREKRGPVLIQQPVKHNPQRVNIYAGTILLPFVNFRRHIHISSLPRQAAGGLFHRPGNAKVTQFIIAALRNKNIFRFDVTMDNIHLPAIFQRLAYIHSQMDNIAPAHGAFSGRIVQKRGQQFHPEYPSPPLLYVQ